MPVEYATRTTEYILYDGTNSAEVLDAVIPLWGGDVPAAIVSESAGVLVLDSGTGNTVNASISVGDRFEIRGWQVVNATDWANKFVKV